MYYFEHYFECKQSQVCAATAAGEDTFACDVRHATAPAMDDRRAVCLKCTGTPAARIKLEIRLATFAEVSQIGLRKGVRLVKACHQSHIPRLSASNALHSRARLPKRRRNDRESPRSRVFHSFSLLHATLRARPERSPSPTRAVARARSYARLSCWAHRFWIWLES